MTSTSDGYTARPDEFEEEVDPARDTRQNRSNSEEEELHAQSPPDTSGNNAFVKLLYRVLGPVAPAVAGLAFGNIVIIVLGVCAVGFFGVLRSWLIPRQFHELPAYLQYPTTSHHGNTTNTEACADVAINGVLPVGHFELDASLHVVTSPTDHSRNLHLQHGVVMCSLELLLENSSEVVSSSRPLFLPESHWLTRLYSAAIRGPFVALGLMDDERISSTVEMLESVRLSRGVFASIENARVCIRPPLPTFTVEVHFDLRLNGIMRFIQGRPWTVGLIIFISTVVCGWIVMGFLGILIFLSQTCRGGAPRSGTRDDTYGGTDANGSADIREREDSSRDPDTGGRAAPENVAPHGRSSRPSANAQPANSSVNTANIENERSGTNIALGEQRRGPAIAFTGVRRRLP